MSRENRQRKEQRLKRLESSLQREFRDEHTVDVGDSVRASVLAYAHNHPAGAGEALAARLEGVIQRRYAEMESPPIPSDVRDSVFRKIRPLEKEQPFTLADALWRVTWVNTPAAACLALYVWTTGIIPDYPLETYPTADSDSAEPGDSR